MALILDGVKINKKIKEELAIKVREFSVPPHLLIFSSQPSKASRKYIEKKIEFGKKIGCEVEHIEFNGNDSIEDIKKRIIEANNNERVNGIIFQFPISEDYNKFEIIDSIDPRKDVDGLTSYNFSFLSRGYEGYFIPATTKGIITLLKENNIELSGEKVVIIGRSALVGRPTAFACLNREATVSICHTKTKSLEDEIRKSNIVISATGIANLITSDMVREDQVIIDVGISINELNDKKLVGDVDFENVSKIVSAISPTPGGVGPMTVASLFQNLLKAKEMQELKN